ncbi:MAG TPA: hypothetical protein VMG81_05000 [Thermoplasmata archaeon]|nr:hypothetical protein [Thermoplasmata archaeon]
MSAEGNRRLGLVFGILAAVLLIVDGLVQIVAGVFFLAVGSGFGLVTATLSRAVILFVFGFLFGFLALLGHSRAEDRSLAAGIGLLVLALVGWLLVGLGSGLLGILATILALLAGIFYLVARR